MSDTETKRRIGIIGAMQEEIDLIHGNLTHIRQTDKAGIRFYDGVWHEERVVLCRSGVGKVNAAVCTQLLVERFHVDAIIFTGVAGAVDPDLAIGDIVISTDCMQHDMDATPLGFERGVIPYAPLSVFAANAGLVELAKRCAGKLYPDRVKAGRVLSGDQFIADRNKVRTLYLELGGACTEMEGAAVAQVCTMNDIPFVIIRSMSDKADGSAHINFAEFTIAAAGRSYEIVNEMVGQWYSRIEDTVL